MVAILEKKYPGCIERLRKQGHHGLAVMAETMARPKDIDIALGYSGAASHWLSGSNGVSNGASRAADLWVQANLKLDPAPDPMPPIKEEAIFMVVVPIGKGDKVRRVLTLMGCEVESVD